MAGGMLPPAQKRTLAILPKLFAGLSFLGSLYIVSDFLRKRQRRKMAYHRLVFAMSVIDMFTSTTYFLSTWPMPAYTGAFQAVGNDMTCAAQAFVQQFGLSVPLYNATLPLYYYLVTRSKSKRSYRALRNVELLMHGLPLSAGLGTAIAALVLGLYGPAGSWCWIESKYGAYRMGFWYGPLFCCLSSAMIFTVMLYRLVKRQEMRTERWGSQCTTSRLSQQTSTNSTTDATEESKARGSARGSSKGRVREGARPSWQSSLFQSINTSGLTAMSSTIRSSIAGSGSSRRDDGARKRKLSKEWAAQGFWYTAAFLYTWVFHAATRISQLIMGPQQVHFGLLVMFMMTLPGQGFWNFLVYNRRRYLA